MAREGERGLKEAFGTTEQNAQALTLDDALGALSRLCFQRQEIGGQEVLQLARPDARQADIFAAWGITPPTTTRPAKANSVGRGVASPRQLIIQ